jgi:hypothetical protein
MERGTVSSRVALLLRSAEVKPLFERFVQLELNFLFLYYLFTLGQVYDNFEKKQKMYFRAGLFFKQISPL